MAFLNEIFGIQKAVNPIFEISKQLMVSEGIPFKDTGFFSQLLVDYLEKHPDLEPFYNRFPEHGAFEGQIQDKSKSYDPEQRQILHAVLKEQYEGLTPSPATISNIDALQSNKTFTVVTGHQLNLFTGPLYFHYKILTTIKLCAQLSDVFPEYRFVPIYWMATEDHDFEEINHFYFKGKAFRWNINTQGAVGRVSTEGLVDLFESFSSDLGAGTRANELRALFKHAYLEHSDLTSATRYLVNALFGNTGLVIIDGDDSRLKARFATHLKADLFNHLAHAKVSESISKLEELYPGYEAQVNPREINLFYMDRGMRSRLVQESDSFKVLDTDLKFNRNELETEIREHPERFSPNVITRPLYQEVLLPNLCYVGGAGELAYWLELKSYFEASGISFPMLLLRNGALIRSKKQLSKSKKLGISNRDLLLNPNHLVNKKIREISNIDINLDPQRKYLKGQFEALYALAAQTDASFFGAVKAQEKKQLKGLNHLEQRLLLAQKRKLKDQVGRILALHNELFPNGGLQERKCNFASFYLETGADWTANLAACFEPLGGEFTLITY
ncbi:MAG: hypothetical protein RLZZ241_1041 [Bacteroidota bacterium]